MDYIYHNQQIMQGEISLDKSLQIAFLDLFINNLKACVVCLQTRTRAGLVYWV